jgi:hypothetical protein
VQNHTIFAPFAPPYATSALLFIACKRGKDVKVVDRLDLAAPDPLEKGKGKGAYLNLPHWSDELPLFLQYYT